MSDFRQITSSFWASPQITPAEVAEAAALGFALIINNRPEGEAADQTPGAQIAEATRAAGMEYQAIPISGGGFDQGQLRAMAEALTHARGPVLAYCRSGTRSTFLWSLVQAMNGGDPTAIAAEAAGAGYDVAPIMPLLNQLAASGRT